MSIKMLYEKDGTTPMGSAMNVGYPTTSGGTALTSGTPYPAPSNGWVSVSALYGNQQEIKIAVNGMIRCSQKINWTTDTSHWGALSYPVRKGQTVTATFPSGGRGQRSSQTKKHKLHTILTHGFRPCVRLREQGVC